MSTESQQNEGQTPTTETEIAPVVEPVGTDRAINASLDEIEDPTELRAIVKKLRGENAKRRTEDSALKAQIEEYNQWKQSQMTELEKTQAQLNEVKGLLKQTEIDKIKLEFSLDEDDLELVADDDLDRMRAKAEKLTARNRKQTTGTAPTKTNLHAGTRGNPVGSGEASMEEEMTKWLRGQL